MHSEKLKSSEARCHWMAQHFCFPWFLFFLITVEYNFLRILTFRPTRHLELQVNKATDSKVKNMWFSLSSRNMSELRFGMESQRISSRRLSNARKGKIGGGACYTVTEDPADALPAHNVRIWCNLQKGMESCEGTWELAVIVKSTQCIQIRCVNWRSGCSWLPSSADNLLLLLPSPCWERELLAS